eukprot:NODE_865_length_1147_cov_108.657843_g823_i0.p1 GENE.NODE_865_length_1147_cov_108.657843_g823_i0~~NODE_865_length_1147_cov_108.657843_g823_i0.p1  ORF type:complete len:333 (-),score=23.47 NODE_865_length_1147_cov_108.657843_g823_i0:54-1052(-)
MRRAPQLLFRRCQRSHFYGVVNSTKDKPYNSYDWGMGEAANPKGFTHRMKAHSGVPGCPVDPGWRPLLIELYEDILVLCKQLPADAPFRIVMEEVHTKWLDIVTSTDDYQVVEQAIGFGPVEFLLQQGCRDIDVMERYIQDGWWKAPDSLEQVKQIEEYSKSVDGRVGRSPGVFGQLQQDMVRSVHAVHPDVRVWRILVEQYPNLRGSSVATGAAPSAWLNSRTLDEWQKVLDTVLADKPQEEQNSLIKLLATESQYYQLAYELKHPRYRVEKAPWVRELMLSTTAEDFQEHVANHEYLQRHLPRFNLHQVPDNLRDVWADQLSYEQALPVQ